MLHSPTPPTHRSFGRVAEITLLFIGSLALSTAESLFFKQLPFNLHSGGSQRLSSLGLDERDMAILTTVAHCRLITTLQLQRLHFANHHSLLSSARACRRALKRLAEHKIISRRKRRIGGVRSGSASYIYSIGTVGAKLLDTANKRLHSYITDPSDYFFEHTLEIAELYTRIHELNAVRKIHLLELQTEPDCWRQFKSTAGKLRPDLFVLIAKDGEEYCYFIELDRGTAHLPSILKKLHQYVQYYASGVEQNKNGVFPQVLWIVPDARRELALNKAIKTTQKYPDGLFVIKTTVNALEYLCSVCV